jgi:25S rRNA (cytosine2278-C5)-methyltransferase
MDRISQKPSKEIDQDRIANLSSFQSQILRKASSFPNVNTIVYSTCSIHKEENEDVVARFLQEKNNGVWEVSSPTRFNAWNRRGERYLSDI